MLLLWTGSGRRQERAMQTQRLITTATPKLLAPAVHVAVVVVVASLVACDLPLIILLSCLPRGKMGLIAVVYGVYSGGVVGLIRV